MRITAARRELAAALRTDWGTLEAGTHVLDGEYAYLVYKPGNPAHWYVMGQPARHVTIPTHLLLRVGFLMQTAVTPGKPSRQQRIACERDAVVLSARRARCGSRSRAGCCASASSVRDFRWCTINVTFILNLY
eukprot:scaffold36170_cov44-Phaeocystis_antarctica.AAC.1